MEDRLRFLPAVGEHLQVRPFEFGRSRLGEVYQRIGAVVQAFERLKSATHEFARGCTTSHLQAIRTLTGDLATAAAALAVPWDIGPDSLLPEERR